MGNVCKRLCIRNKVSPVSKPNFENSSKQSEKDISLDSKDLFSNSQRPVSRDLCESDSKKILDDSL